MLESDDKAVIVSTAFVPHIKRMKREQRS
jgi:hypothetical protein